MKMNSLEIASLLEKAEKFSLNHKSGENHPFIPMNVVSIIPLLHEILWSREMLKKADGILSETSFYKDLEWPGRYKRGI